MVTNGDYPSEEESPPQSPTQEPQEGQDVQDAPLDDDQQEARPKGPAPAPKSALKKGMAAAAAHAAKPELPEQPDPATLDLTKLSPISPEIISRQATINIGTIGHVAHGKSTVVKAISGVQTVRFKNELERNITIKLGYANAKVYKCDNPECPRPTCYRSYKSEKEVDPPCERDGCSGTYRLQRHVS